MELAVTDWVRDVDSRAQYRHRFATLLDCGSMRRAIDSARHPADDRDTGPDQSACQGASGPFTVGSRLSRSDDRDARSEQSRPTADRVKLRRRRRKVEKLRGISVRAALPAFDLEIWRTSGCERIELR
jgi:hypothetical protein